MEDQIKDILAQLQQHDERLRALESRPKAAKEVEAVKEDEDILLAIANKVADCEESIAIQKKVLDQKSVEAKVLLCFYISQKYFGNAWLNSGDVERITSHLGIKITTGNASNKMKALRAYLENGKARKQGSPTPCRLNRNGVKRFEEILNG